MEDINKIDKGYNKKVTKKTQKNQQGCNIRINEEFPVNERGPCFQM